MLRANFAFAANRGSLDFFTLSFRSAVTSCDNRFSRRVSADFPSAREVINQSGLR
jgi:hypothetical protein